MRYNLSTGPYACLHVHNYVLQILS